MEMLLSVAVSVLGFIVAIDYKRGRETPERLARIEAEVKSLRRDVERALALVGSFGAYHPHHDGERAT